MFWGWHAGHRQPTAVPVAQIVRKLARVREEQRKCTHLRQAEHWRESLPTSRWQMEQGYLGWGWLLMGPGLGWTLPLIRSNARIRRRRKGVRSIKSRGAAQLWLVNGRPSEKTVRDNGGDLSVEPLGRSVLPFRPIPIGEGTALPREGGRKLVQLEFFSPTRAEMSVIQDGWDSARREAVKWLSPQNSLNLNVNRISTTLKLRTVLAIFQASFSIVEASICVSVALISLFIVLYVIIYTLFIYVAVLW